MPSQLATDSNATVDPQPVAHAALSARIRAELARSLKWPASLMELKRPLDDLGAAMDLGKLANLAAATAKGNELSFAIISKEYIQIGLNWIYAMNRLGLKNFFIVAGDKFTSERLDGLGVGNVLAEIDESEFDPTYLSSTGFSAKGLAVSAFKFPVALFLVKSGYSAVLSDADAVWLNDPMPYLRGADVAFQRIVYHPPDIAMLWGFGACGGFNSFRNGTKTIAFLERCVEENQALFCDQVALNLALLEGDPAWHCENADWALPAAGSGYDRAGLEAGFTKYANYPIMGELRQGGARILALPHDKFWRHGLVASAVEDMVICHPNSPKDDIEKMNLLQSMGLRFQPAGL